MVALLGGGGTGLGVVRSLVDLRFAIWIVRFAVRALSVRPQYQMSTD